MDELIISNDEATRRYVARLGTEMVGYVEYDPIGSDGLLIKHTEVAAPHEGKGYGSRLVAWALDDARQRQLAVVPICPYAIAFIRRHREYLPVVRSEMRATI